MADDTYPPTGPHRSHGTTEKADGDDVRLSSDEAATPAPSEASKAMLSMHEQGHSGVDDDTSDVYVVGIGASAGGLDALVAFFAEMPPDSGMAFVVVQHLSPDHKSMMSELLAKHTSMPVQQIDDGIQVKPNHVYLIPPRKNLTMFHRQLFLDDQDRSQGHLNYPIDVFFESLAEDAGSRAIVVILSGTGSDGTRGLRMIKSSGGLVVAQDDATAQYPGMPQSAVQTGLVDRVLPPAAMPEALVRFVKYPRRVRKELQEGDAGDAKNGLRKILLLVRKHSGVDFTAYKPSTVGRRIEHRMSIRQVAGLDTYARYLEEHPDEIPLLYRELLVGVTRFFRDQEAFAVLRRDVIPTLFDQVESRGGTAVRCWVAGCSTGEEAYSIAILLHEHLERHPRTFDVKVFATDVDQESLNKAASGVYPDSIVADVSPERLQRFFLKMGEQYQIARELRQSVIFAPHNLLKDPPFSKLDLISCRNLLIYLKPDQQRRVLSNFSYALSEGGCLFLGTSENLGGHDTYFTPHNSKYRLFRYRGGRPSNVTISHDPSPHQGTSDLDGTGHPERWKQHPVALLETFFEDVMVRYMPPAVIVDDQNRILHVFGDADQYLRIPSGQTDMDVLRMARGNLRVLVGTALHKARTTGERVVYASVPAGEDGTRIDLIVDVDSGYEQGALGIVIFNDVRPMEAMPETTAESFDIDVETQEQIDMLRRRLRYTEENLQATVEELETSNEELQATNEELMASNEELQSTNEELHSVNEELVTVNAELQEKIRKLTEVNDDLDNLFQSTKIRALFLDGDLCIRKFTKAMTDLINLLPSDEGRPLSDLAHAFNRDDLDDVASSVLESGEPVETNVRWEKEGWYVMRVLPYRTTDQGIDGVVFTFQEVTLLKKANEELEHALRNQKALERFERVWAHLPDAVVQFTADGHAEAWNPAATRLFGDEPFETKGNVAWDVLCTNIYSYDAVPDIDALLDDASAWRGAATQRRADGSSVDVDLVVTALDASDGTREGWLMVSRPIDAEVTHAASNSLSDDAE